MQVRKHKIHCRKKMWTKKYDGKPQVVSVLIGDKKEAVKNTDNNLHLEEVSSASPS